MQASRWWIRAGLVGVVVGLVVLGGWSGVGWAATCQKSVFPNFSVFLGTVRLGTNPIGLSGVMMTLTGPSCTDTQTTKAGGLYIFQKLGKGSTYTVTPTKTGCMFLPTSATLVIGSIAHVDFSASDVTPGSCT